MCIQSIRNLSSSAIASTNNECTCTVAAPYVLLNGVSGKACSGCYCISGCTNASVVFSWIVATLLHHTRDMRVERMFLDVSGVPSLKWNRGE